MGRTHLFAFACSVCVCLTAGSELAWSQAASPAGFGAGGAMEPGKALVLGIREYRRGEYEQAARALNTAKQGVDKLSPLDRKSLEEYLSKTEQALTSRSQAVAQLDKIESMLAQGNSDAAATKLQSLSSNPYLSQEDRVRVQALNEKLGDPGKRSFLGTLFSRDGESATGMTLASAGTDPAPPAVGKNVSRADAKKMLEQGRQLFEQGKHDLAMRWAMAANNYDGRWFFGDSPEKLMRDIQFAKERAEANKPASAAATAPAVAKNEVMKDDPAVMTAAATMPVSETKPAAGSDKGAVPQAVKADSKVQPAQAVADEDAKEAAHRESSNLVAEAKKCRDAGDYEKAKQLCEQAKALQRQYGFTYQLFEETPDKLMATIQQKMLTPEKSSDTAMSSAPSIVLPSETPADPEKRAAAVELLKKARRAQDSGDMKTAVDLAMQVQEMGVAFGPNEDSPEKIFAAHRAIRDRSTDRKTGADSAPKKELAKQHMEAARSLCDSGFYREALQRAKQAAELGAAFEPNEQRPEQLIVEIQSRAKMSANAEEVVKSLGEAAQPGTVAPGDTAMSPGHTIKENVEQLMARGNFAEARRTAKVLQQGPYGMKEDAEILLVAIDRAEKATGFLEAGKNAMKRGDIAQANAFFKEAAKQEESLDDDRKQQLQELLQTTMVADGSSAGRARASDMPNRFANMQQPPEEPTPPPGPTGIDVLSEAQQRQQILAQQLRREVIDALQKAQRLLRTDPDAAIALLESTLSDVQESPLDRDLTTPMMQQIERRIKLYRVDRKTLELQQLERERQVALQIQRQRQDTVQLEQQTMIKELMKRFAAAMDDANYAEAEAVAYQITEIAPDEVAGHAALWKAQMSQSFAVNEDFEHRRQQGWIQAIRLAQEAAVPFPDEPPIVYIDPKEWEELTIRRAKYKTVDLSEKSEATQKIEKALERPVSFDFQETPLVDVVDFLREYTGVNIVLDQRGLDIVMVDPDTPVTLSLQQVQLKSALKLLLAQFELVALIKDEVLMITDEQETGQEPVTRVYPVADLVIPIIDFNSGGVGLGGALGGGNTGQGGLGGGGGFGGFGGGGGGGGGFGGGGGGLGGGGLGGGGLGGGGGGGQGNLTGGGGQATGEDIAEEVIELIRNTISPDTWEDNGGAGTIEYFQPNRSFVVTQTQAVHDQLADLLTQLRRLQDLQVAVEVRLITVEETFFERIGVDFDVTFDNNNDKYIQDVFNNELIPPGLPVLPNLISPLINQMGLPTGNHERGVTIGRNPTGGPTGNFNIPVSQSSFAAATVPQLGSVANTSLGGTQFGIAFLNDIDVFLLLEAVQGDVRSNIAQAPRVTLFNGQTSSVIVADQVPFVTDATPVVSAGAVSFDPTISVVTAGTTLTVQAVVSADRRYVRLQVVPVITAIQAVSTQSVVGQASQGGGGIIGGSTGTAQINIQLPTVNLISVLTTVSVPDGGTVLLGGLKTHQEARNEFGTPILSHLPYVNRLFKNAASARFTQNLMLMVTPRIIIQEEEEANLGVQTSFAQ